MSKRNTSQAASMLLGRGTANHADLRPPSSPTNECTSTRAAGPPPSVDPLRPPPHRPAPLAVGLHVHVPSEARAAFLAEGAMPGPCYRRPPTLPASASSEGRSSPTKPPPRSASAPSLLAERVAPGSLHRGAPSRRLPGATLQRTFELSGSKCEIASALPGTAAMPGTSFGTAPKKSIPGAPQLMRPQQPPSAPRRPTGRTGRVAIWRPPLIPSPRPPRQRRPDIDVVAQQHRWAEFTSIRPPAARKATLSERADRRVEREAQRAIGVFEAESAKSQEALAAFLELRYGQRSTRAQVVGEAAAVG